MRRPKHIAGLPVLSVRQPYASALVTGHQHRKGKRCENRSRRTRYRGWMVVVATKRRYKSADIPEVFKPHLPKSTQIHVAVGLIKISDCRPVDVPGAENAFWRTGPWCWGTSHSVRFDFMYTMKGALWIQKAPAGLDAMYQQMRVRRPRH